MAQPIIRPPLLLVAALAGLMALLSACSSPTVVVPPTGQPLPPTSPIPEAETEAEPELARKSDSREVVLALMQQSQQQNQAGNPSRSIALLERALRIAPKDAGLWLELARRHLQLGRFALAQQFAGKALLLAHENAELTAAANAVIAQARTGAGSTRG